FKRLNAPRKGRLGDMSQLSRPAETACFSQAHKVFKPLGIHVRIIAQTGFDLAPLLAKALESKSAKRAEALQNEHCHAECRFLSSPY
ncbi:MAG: hypothetical protein RJA08_698, partial [Pseudomonadota bacterium]